MQQPGAALLQRMGELEAEVKLLKQTNDILESQVKILTSEAVEHTRRLEALEQLLQGRPSSKIDIKGKEKVKEEEPTKENPPSEPGRARPKRRFLEDEDDDDIQPTPAPKRSKSTPRIVIPNASSKPARKDDEEEEEAQVEDRPDEKQASPQFANSSKILIYSVKMNDLIVLDDEDEGEQAYGETPFAIPEEYFGTL